MPTTKSAKKRHRQSEERRIRNKTTKAMLKTEIKKALADKSATDSAPPQFRLTAKKLDQAAAKGVIHPNKASRLKSRISKALKKAKAPAAAS